MIDDLAENARQVRATLRADRRYAVTPVDTTGGVPRLNLTR